MNLTRERERERAKKSTQSKWTLKSSDKRYLQRACQNSGKDSINKVACIRHSLSLSLILTHVIFVSHESVSTAFYIFDTFNMVMLFTISKYNKLNWFIFFLFLSFVRYFFLRSAISCTDFCSATFFNKIIFVKKKHGIVVECLHSGYISLESIPSGNHDWGYVRCLSWIIKGFFLFF